MVHEFGEDWQRETGLFPDCEIWVAGECWSLRWAAGKGLGSGAYDKRLAVAARHMQIWK